MVDEPGTCTANQSVVILLLGAVIGAGILAMLLHDCKEKLPRQVWLDIW